MTKQCPKNSQYTGQTLSEPIPLVFHPLVSSQPPNQKLILALLSLKQREVVLKVKSSTMQCPNNGIPRRQDAPRAIFSIPQFLFSPQARNLYKLYFEQRGGVLLLTLSHHVLTSDFQSRPAVSFLATCPGQSMLA